LKKSVRRKGALALVAAYAALRIEDCPDFFAVQKVRCPAISLLDQSFLDIIPVLAFARSGELHGPPKYLLVLLPHRPSAVQLRKDNSVRIINLRGNTARTPIRKCGNPLA
jgi:hypothetical protein